MAPDDPGERVRYPRRKWNGIEKIIEEVENDDSKQEQAG